MNYEDNTYHFRQDSTFLYFFGLPYAGLAAIIDVDEDKEIIFGDELTMDHICLLYTSHAHPVQTDSIGHSLLFHHSDANSWIPQPFIFWNR